MPLENITAAANAYAIAHADLTDVVQSLESALAQLKASYLRDLRKSVAKAADKRDELKRLIEAEPELFVKPRTLVINGIKVGYQKGKGGIDFDDAEAVVERIRKQFPDDEALLNVKRTPNKEALAQLSVVELKKLGCTVRDTADEIVIKPTNDVDKVVNALLKDATEAE
jgi:hypothetical protein